MAYRTSLTRRLQLVLSVILGFSLWKISYTDTPPKVIPSKTGICISLFNLLVLIFTLYINHQQKSLFLVLEWKFVIQIVVQIHHIFLTVLPLLLLLAFWIHTFKYKRSLELMLKVRKILDHIEIDADATSWTFKLQVFGTLLVFTAYSVCKFYTFKRLEATSEDVHDKLRNMLGFLMILVFTFASIFNLVSAVAFIGMRLNMIRGKLNELLKSNKKN